MTRRAVAAMVLAALMTGCTRDSHEATGRRSAAGDDTRPRNVLLITLDTCRPDFLACYRDEGHADTPNLDRLAEEGVLFERAITPVPSTLPSHASILTGLTPLRHGIHDNGIYVLDPGHQTLAELLKARGYRTAAFVSAFVLDHRFGLDAGFDRYDDTMNEPLREGEVPTFRPGTDSRVASWLSRRFAPYQRRAEETVLAATEWLRHASPDPFLVWVHFFDPHEPYDPPDSLVQRYDPGYHGAMTGDAEAYIAAARDGRITQRDHDHMVARYRGEVSYVDQAVGALRLALEEQNLLEKTIILVVGDHGEGLGEHGLYFEHHSHLYRELVRVPFILRVPDPDRTMKSAAGGSAGRNAGRRVPDMVRTFDVLPTVLELVGAGAPAGIDGHSLAGWVTGSGDVTSDRAASDEAAMYLEALCHEQALPVPIERRGIRTSRWKLIRTTRHDSGPDLLELYDLENDPHEIRNLSDREGAVAWTLQEQLDEALRVAALEGEGSNAVVPLDGETREKLRSLGYIR